MFCFRINKIKIAMLKEKAACSLYASTVSSLKMISFITTDNK